MPFYPRAVGRGLIDPASGIDEVRIEVEDDSGNTAVLTFPVTYDPSAAAATVSIPTDAEAVDFRRHYSRTTDGLKVTILPAHFTNRCSTSRRNSPAGLP